MTQITKKIIKEKNLTLFTVKGPFSPVKVIEALEEMYRTETTLNAVWDISAADVSGSDDTHIDQILDIAKNCESTKFWLPTRMYKFRKWESLLSEMDSTPNLAVRRSGDAIDGTIIAGKNTSTIFDPAGDPPAGAYVCPAYGQGGKCLDCRACWDKEIQVIAYPQHGRKAKAYSANIIARSA